MSGEPAVGAGTRPAPTSPDPGGGALRVVYVLRNYPQLSQTFVRNEVVALRELGVRVDVRPLGSRPDPDVPAGWGGDFAVLPVAGAAQVAADLRWWLAHDPAALLRMARRAARLRGQGLRACGLRRALGAARALHGGGVGAVHAHFAWEGMLVALYVGPLLGVPVSTTVHAADIYVPWPHLVRRLAALDLVVTVCRHNVDFLRRAGLGGRTPVAVVPCGVEVPGDVPEGAPERIVSVGRLVEKKGFDVLLRALPAVLREVPGARLEIVGDGPLGAELWRLAAELGVAHAVDWAGARSHAESLERIGSAAVFALACRADAAGDTDAVPVVLREAMARARGVVTTAIAGIPENVDATTGWVVAPGDAGALAAALVHALTDDAERRRRGEAARRLTAERFTLRRCAELLHAELAGAAHRR
ncbi:hypothetical protein NUM3379_08520 [Kineococcus sp. NUM-3379]